MKSQEPAIDHTVDYADTTQADQLQQAADELVNQQQFVQFAAQCQKCKGTCSATEHHSICWQCWHRISSRDQRAEQSIVEIHNIDQREVDPTDQSCTTTIRMEPDIWYRFAKTFQDLIHDDTESVKKCATCNITNVIVSNKELRTHCNRQGDCKTVDTREAATVIVSSELHVKKDAEGQYDWSPQLQSPTDYIEDQEETVEVQAVQRSSKRETTESTVLSICGIEPNGSQYRVMWANWDNKKRGDVMKFASILGSSRLVEDYLRSPAGQTRMNTLRKMFYGTASKLMQADDRIKAFKYNNWEKQIQNEGEPNKKVYRVVVLRLEHCGKPSMDSFVQHLKKFSAFPAHAKFTVWLIPYGFHSQQHGDLIFPIHGLSPDRVAPLFKRIDKDTMDTYLSSLRTSTDKDGCRHHWVRTVAADARDSIIHHEDDDRYNIPTGFYSKN